MSASRLYPAASFEALGLGLGRLPAVADQPQMEAEGWDPVLLAACWSWQRQVQVQYSDMFAPNARRAASRALPHRRYQCVPAAVASGCPVAVHPTLHGSRSFCGTAECIQDASLGLGCWLVAASCFPSDPSRTRR
ncbi:hypothetical protein TRIATDRAFT_85753 [Trichoderma atroviride IMI 206040]|uniref:Uncharacterized protein n=1 Tax=Hypocrea atroviridis (strain ATCC 20476 / IMI 206040) TaxID=452589 RepID=G9P262_HYPAI|nr:uncharacterized protein TRIATDRAFT_85753 [Trichoderma atroviride IMI 206040]EHK43434.1 hypothetical protein TRIATDRAFT_85753 [Trichoderma atroviride IMI 206040]